MPDHIEDILEKHKSHFLKLNELLLSGVLSTRSNGTDTTPETIKENESLIKQIDRTLERYRADR